MGECLQQQGFSPRDTRIALALLIAKMLHLLPTEAIIVGWDSHPPGKRALPSAHCQIGLSHCSALWSSSMDLVVDGKSSISIVENRQ